MCNSEKEKFKRRSKIKQLVRKVQLHIFSEEEFEKLKRKR